LKYYPVCLDLHYRLILLVGGGWVALRKLVSLIIAGAQVRLVSPELVEDTKLYIFHSIIELRYRVFELDDLDGVWLVVCATNNAILNQAIAQEAELAEIFINVVDVPYLCSFIVPALVKRGDLLIAVSTSGSAPIVARRVRECLEYEFGFEWEPFLRLMHILRARLNTLNFSDKEKRSFFFALVDSNLFECVVAYDDVGVDAIIAQILGVGCTLDNLGLDVEDLKVIKRKHL